MAKVLCPVCNRKYGKKYLNKHKCRIPDHQILACTLCDFESDFKSNVIRHYLEVHKCVREDIPPQILTAPRSKPERKTCPNCDAVVLVLSRHTCARSGGQAAADLSGDLDRPTVESPSASSTAGPSSAPSGPLPTRTTRSVGQCRKKVRPQKLDFSSEESEEEADPQTGSRKGSGASSTSRPPSPISPMKTRSGRPLRSCVAKASRSASLTLPSKRVARPTKQPLHPIYTRSSSSSDSGAGPRKDPTPSPPPLPVPGKGKGKGKKSLPPRTATWRSAEDLPLAIRISIMAGLAHYQFYNILDHQIRDQIANQNISPDTVVLLQQNSVGRTMADAVGLIKSVYDGIRGRKIAKSPSK